MKLTNEQLEIANNILKDIDSIEEFSLISGSGQSVIILYICKQLNKKGFKVSINLEVKELVRLYKKYSEWLEIDSEQTIIDYRNYNTDVDYVITEESVKFKITRYLKTKIY